MAKRADDIKNKSLTQSTKKRGSRKGNAQIPSLNIPKGAIIEGAAKERATNEKRGGRREPNKFNEFHIHPENAMSNRSRKLNHMRDRLQPLVDEANERMDMVYNKMRLNTRATREAARTLNKAGREYLEEEGDYFNISALHRYREIVREMGRVKNFLSDETSNPNYIQYFAKQIKATESYGDLFGKQYYADYGVGYDASQINEDDASMTYEAFRNIMALRPYEIASQIFESDKILNMLYEQVVESPEFTSNYKRYREDTVEAVTKRVNDILEDELKAREALARGDYDLGGVEGTLLSSFDKMHW